ncbi:MAG: DUF3298 and DUF4163 domain-containing protein [Firmicutes bacterium]|nr:DUF3298 and DUF4163 domain-containing protein [Bacillota bacterium]
MANRSLRTGIIFLLLILFATGASADQSPTVIITQKTEETPAYSLTLNYPRVDGLKNSALAAEINSRWTAEIDAFAAGLIAMASEHFADFVDEGWNPFPYDIQTEVEINTLTDELLSITIYYYQYTGGAHGFTDKRSYNYDLRNGRRLELADLFAPGVDYLTFVTRQIKEQIGESPEYWDFELIDPNQPFFIRDGQVYVYFGLYEIAPYVAGFPEFPIVLAE